MTLPAGSSSTSIEAVPSRESISGFTTKDTSTVVSDRLGFFGKRGRRVGGFVSQVYLAAVERPFDLDPAPQPSPFERLDLRRDRWPRRQAG